jgi:hypothetical protein
MKRERALKLAVLPVAGVVATSAAASTDWAPISGPAPAGANRAAPLPAQAGSDGVFESCSAYFGLGKDGGVMDVVDYDVSDQNGSDGVDHSMPGDTQVVLVLTSDSGETLECAPVEITEEAWAEAMDQVNIGMSEGQTLPPWPGPGHYAYPTVSFQPWIEDFGTVVDARFRVASIPDGHTLVSPTGVAPLVQHFPFWPETDGFYVADQRVFDLVAAGSSPAAASAFAQVLAACEAGDEPDFTPDAIAGVNVVRAYRDQFPWEQQDGQCFSLGISHSETSVLLGLEATIAYTEPIVLAVPDETTTSTTPITTPDPSKPGATAARPIVAAARFTG